MNYEKKYKEAIERMKSWARGEHPECFSEAQKAAEFVFPELKNKDEEIRKALIKGVESCKASGWTNFGNNVDIDVVLAWLKEQGKQKPIDYNKELKKCRENPLYFFDKYVKLEKQKPAWSEEDEKIRKALVDALNKNLGNGIEKYGTTLNAALSWLEKQGSNSVKWQKNTPHNKPAINHSVLMKTIQGIAEGEWQGEDWFQYRWSWTLKDSDVLAWMELSNLDKQGEQKPAVVDFNAKDWYVSKVDGKIHNIYYSVDKVEPKFKVGDYIVSDYCMGRVVEITNDAYLLDTGQGIPFSCENKVHLWTIADAKEGDILAGKIDGDNYILIFKTIKDGWIETYGHYYNAVNRFCVPSQLFCRSYQGTFTPATKEQRNTLMKAMTNAGYTFDFEKLELKKIEDEIEIPFGAKDSELQEETYYIPKGFHAEIDNDKVVIKKGEKSAAWSDEDEGIVLSIEQVIQCASFLNLVPEKLDKIDKWLKSLKERIGE